MESLIQDVRYAIRTLARDRAFAITTVLTLAIRMAPGLPRRSCLE